MEYQRCFNMVTMQTRHFLPPQTEVYPELENYPYSRFSNSLAFTQFQLVSSLPLNEQGMAMNLFDLNGNGIRPDEGFGSMLRRTKPFLNEMTRCGVFGLPKQGVRVMCSEDAAYTLHTGHSRDFSALYPHEVFFAGLLPSLGIPYAYESDPDVSGCVIAVSGQYFQSLPEGRIKALFENNFVLLSGDAVLTLCDMDLGHLAGLQSARFMKQNGGEYTYEQVCESAISARGQRLAPGRASAVIFCCDGLSAQYTNPPVILSEFHNARRQAVCPAQTLVGGRVMVFPFGNLESPTEIPPMLLNPLRQQILQGVLAEAMRETSAAGAFPMILGAAHLTPYAYADGKNRALYLVNAYSDPVDAINLWLPCSPKGEAAWHTSGGGRDAASFAPHADGSFCLPLGLKPMETALLTWETE